MSDKVYISIQEMEHVKLHIWELQQLIDKMEMEGNPEFKRLQHILLRFQSTNPDDDRA